MDTAQSSAYLSENAGPSALAADITTRCLAMIAIALRFVSRRIGGTKYWWDDWLILASMILQISSLGIEIYATQQGLGRHIGYVVQFNSQGLREYSQILFSEQIMYAPEIALIKLSILALYIRLFGVNRRFAIFCYVQCGLVVIWALVLILLFLFQCDPVWVAWDPTRSGGTCMAFQPLFIGTNTVNVAMDLLILLTPLRSIWNLNLPLVKKILVSCILVLGSSSVALSSARLAKLSTLTFEDPTWDDATALIYSAIEANLGVLCACMPVTAPLWNKLFPCASIRSRPTAPSQYKTSSRNKISRIRSHKASGSAQEDENELVDRTNDSAMFIRQTTDITVHKSSRYDGGLEDRAAPYRDI